MEISLFQLGSANALIFFSLFLVVYQLSIFIYRLSFHPLAKFPGPRLAAISTLYRAYFELWKNGKLREHVTELHKIYGPVIRISPNELHFRNPAAYHDIFSSKFDGTKDPLSYVHLGGAVETLFTMGDPAKHRERYRPVASLFSKRHYDKFEPCVQKNVEKFSQLLSAKAQAGQPANLYLGFRSLFLQIVNEFMFSSIPDHLKSLATPEFDDPLNIATDNAVNWTHWLIRNFPNASALVNKVPRKLLKNITGAWEGLTQVREILEQLVAHEKSPNTPKNNDAMARRFLDAHLDPRSSSTIPHPDEVVVAETEVTMWGGITDMSNILPYATFEVAQNPTLQETLLEELKVSWPDCHGPIPSYEVLSKLPYLNAICNESMRLTHGVVYGPPRQVGSKGAQVDGYFVPPKSIVIALSYYVHMDPTLFPEPEKFRPERWFQKDHSNSIMIFSKGRRACPAVHLSKMEILASFATLFRRFKVTPYNTTAKDFEWNQYFSIQYNGRHLHAMLEERKL